MPNVIDSFYKHYRWLSNFWPVPVTFDGVVYPTVEHAYQASKLELPSDRSRILGCSSPGRAKRLVRELPLRADWYDRRLEIMLDLLRQKFTQPDLAAALLRTGDALLIEGNWWGDTYWGMCDGEGENHLGRLLMQVRQELEDTCE